MRAAENVQTATMICCVHTSAAKHCTDFVLDFEDGSFMSSPTDFDIHIPTSSSSR